jgi:site-specific recombinase XerD
MNELSSLSDFSALLQRFFLEWLMQQKNVSPRTISSYRDTFKLLLRYMQDCLGKSAAAITLHDLDTKLVLGFLDYLEIERRNKVRSRNARLAAIHSFARYIALQSPVALHVAQKLLAVPMQRYERPVLGFLSREETRALLAAPDAETWFGQRDRVLLAVLYNTGARVSEVIGILISDVTLDRAPCVRLHGKGRKQRTVPLWKETATLIRDWIQHQSMEPNQPLLPNRQGRTMTRCNVSERLTLAVDKASVKYPSLQSRQISPHTLRHSTAMHMLQAGVDLAVIALWLGHESPETTHGYVQADMAMKERAINSISAPASKRHRYQPPASILKFLEEL